MRIRLRCAAMAALLAAWLPSSSGCSRAGRYPDRPVMLVCPWAAGGGTDRVSREVAVLLEQELGVPVNVVNATGGSGVTGHTRGALARPDGYTLTMITVELDMLHWRGLTTIGPDDFDPLMQLNRDAAALFVRADSPIDRLDTLEAALRDRPGDLKASGTAQGGIWHISLAGWLHALGLPADSAAWVSINGSAPSLQELLSGGVTIVCCSLPEARTLLDAGAIRCLGVMADRRVAAFPDVPTFREQGYDWSIGGWRGLALPNGVPRERAALLLAALEKVVRGDEYRRFMDSAGFDSSILGPPEFAASLEADDAQFGAILNGAAFRPVRSARYGPYAFPTLLAGVLALVVVVLLAGGGLRRPEGVPPLDARGAGRVALVVGWVVAFVALLDLLGYVLAGLVLLPALMMTLGVRRPRALAVSAALVLLSYQVFAVALRVPLPRGWLDW